MQQGFEGAYRGTILCVVNAVSGSLRLHKAG